MTRARAKLRTWTGVIAALLTCAGCGGSLFESDAPVSTTYILRAPALAQSGSGVAVEADLSVGLPQMAPGLETERIAVLKGRQLDYYRGVRWGSQAADVIQTLLVRTLGGRQLFRSVAGEQSRVSSKYFLDVSVHDFQAEYGDGAHEPSVHVSVVARLIRIADRRLVDTLAASALARAESNRMHAVVAAFESAAHQVALELADKLATAASEDIRALQSASASDQANFR